MKHKDFDQKTIAMATIGPVWLDIQKPIKLQNSGVLQQNAASSQHLNSRRKRSWENPKSLVPTILQQSLSIFLYFPNKTCSFFTFSSFFAREESEKSRDPVGFHMLIGHPARATFSSRMVKSLPNTPKKLFRVRLKLGSSLPVYPEWQNGMMGE